MPLKTSGDETASKLLFRTVAFSGPVVSSKTPERFMLVSTAAPQVQEFPSIVTFAAPAPLLTWIRESNWVSRLGNVLPMIESVVPPAPPWSSIASASPSIVSPRISRAMTPGATRIPLPAPPSIAVTPPLSAVNAGLKLLAISDIPELRVTLSE